MSTYDENKQRLDTLYKQLEQAVSNKDYKKVFDIAVMFKDIELACMLQSLMIWQDVIDILNK